ELEMDKTVDDATPAEGQQVTFTLTVSNNGETTATNVLVIDLLPAGVTFVSADPAPDFDDQTGEWSIASIAPGESAQLDITATVNPGTAGTIITNVAVIDSQDGDDPNPDNNEDEQDIRVLDFGPEL